MVTDIPILHNHAAVHKLVHKVHRRQSWYSRERGYIIIESSQFF